MSEKQKKLEPYILWIPVFVILCSIGIIVSLWTLVFSIPISCVIILKLKNMESIKEFSENKE